MLSRTLKTNTTHINNIQVSDVDLSEKIQILKVNHLSKNGIIIAKDTDTALLSVRKSSKITKMNHKNTKNHTNHFINT